MASTSSFYEVLGVPASATVGEIKAAYRRLARAYHPDVAAAMNNNDASPTKFVKIQAAYSTLSDPNKRADYDRDLFVTRRPPRFRASPGLSAAGYAGDSRRRSWETDQCW